MASNHSAPKTIHVKNVMHKAKPKRKVPEMMQDKTTSKIPKGKDQKKNWIRARQIVAKESGTMSEKKLPWGLVTHIMQNADKAGKVIKRSDVTKAKKSKAVSKYK